MLTAWGDESGSRPDLDPGAYLLAAAMIEENDVPAVRAAMESLRREEPKVHWYSRDDEHRTSLVETVADLPLTTFCVVHVDAAATDRRHRRKCLEFLLPHLAEMPCSSITLESRSRMDASDLVTMQLLRSRRAIGAGLRIEHALGRSEPALWVADTVCGAVVQDRIGNPTFLQRLGSGVEVHII